MCPSKPRSPAQPLVFGPPPQNDERHKFLRQSFHEWAGHSIAQSLWARASYQQQRERGQDHHAAVPALAFKWIRIVFRCWQDRVAYDENKYLAALARRGSPLSPVLATATPLCNPCGS